MPAEKTQGSRRIEREKRTIEAMVHIYCSGRHGKNVDLCAECARLLDYAKARLDTCPFQDAKPACNHCKVHCYSRQMRKRVKQVMGYSGPRMTYRYPMLSLRHLFDKLRRVPTLANLKRKKTSDPGS